MIVRWAGPTCFARILTTYDSHLNNPSVDERMLRFLWLAFQIAKPVVSNCEIPRSGFKTWLGRSRVRQNAGIHDIRPHSGGLLNYLFNPNANGVGEKRNNDLRSHARRWRGG